jgi:hypothetical protein
MRLQYGEIFFEKLLGGGQTGMQVEKISCNSCGAPLEVAETTQFATCRHCGAKLSIQRTDTATFTEVLEQLAAKTDQLSEQVQSLTGHSELAALDREWQMDRENYMVTRRDGARHIPSEAGAIGGGIAITIFGCVWIGMASSMNSMGPSFGPSSFADNVFPLFGFVFIIVGIVASFISFNKAGDHRRAQQRYRRRRAEIQNRSRSRDSGK